MTTVMPANSGRIVAPFDPDHQTDRHLRDNP
jgi:hypothetical protein